VIRFDRPTLLKELSLMSFSVVGSRYSGVVPALLRNLTSPGEHNAAQADATAAKERLASFSATPG
jgi:hypothetical protein